MTLEEMKQILLKLSAYLSSVPQPAPKPLPQYTPDNNPLTVETIRASHSSAWSGGALADRKAMFNLANRVCREEGLGISMTADLRATVWGESGWNQWCINDKNRNGSTDYGLCQFNDGKLNGKALWIGAGAAFTDPVEVLTNPEKCLRVMAREFKAGHQHYWMAYRPTDAAWRNNRLRAV